MSNFPFPVQRASAGTADFSDIDGATAYENLEAHWPDMAAVTSMLDGGFEIQTPFATYRKKEIEDDE